MPYNGPIELKGLKMAKNTKALRTCGVFQDAPGMISAYWSEITSAENQLASILCDHPIGLITILDGNAWLLQEEGEELVLVHAQYIGGKLVNESTRFDIDLGWVDEEEESLLSYASLVRQAASNLNFITNPKG